LIFGTGVGVVAGSGTGVDGRGVEVGAGVGVADGVPVGDGVGLAVGDGLGVGSGVAVGWTVGVGGIGVADGIGVAGAFGVAVGAISGVAVGGTGVAEGVLVGSGRGVGPGRSTGGVGSIETDDGVTDGVGLAVGCGISAVFPEHATTTALISITRSGAKTFNRRTTALQLV
jgi:hypothetical protein